MAYKTVTATPWWKHDAAMEVAGGVRFHLPPALNAAYGDPSRYDLTSPYGLLDYVIAFVNRTEKSIALKALPATRPVGRERLRALLDAAVNGPRMTVPAALRRAAAKGLHWEHDLARTLNGWQWRAHAYVLDAGAFYALVSTLMLDRRLRDAISQCRCGDFFLKRQPERGRPQTRYCSEACRTKGDRAAAAPRMLRMRARKALAESYLSKETIERAVDQAFEGHPDVKTTKQLVAYAKELLRSSRASLR